MYLSLVTETFPPEVNGVAMTMRRMVDSLIQRGHEIQVVRPRQKQPARDERAFQEIVTKGFPIPTYPEMQLGYPAWSTLEKEWKSKRPDLVHIVTEGPLGLSAVQTARKMHIPLLSSFHTNFHQYTRHYRMSLLYGPMLDYIRWIHNLTQSTLVPDGDLMNELIGLDFKDCKIWGRGVDCDLFHPNRRDKDLRKDWGAGDDDIVALHVSRVAREKNIPLVIETWRALKNREPRMKLVLVGDGPYIKSLKKAYPEPVYAGLREGTDLARHYASADLFLFASTTETFGNVVLEALASGLVVVTYDYAAGRQFITEEESGYLADFNDPDDFKANAFRALDQRAKWPQISTRARECAVRMPWSKIVDLYEQSARTYLLGDETQ